MSDESLVNAVEFRPMVRCELDTAVAWAAAEGWNPGRFDTDVFWETDPEGYVAATLDGELVATGSIVSYGGEFGFMGFFIVRSDLRGKGLGNRFWHWRRDQLKARLKPGAAIGMDGVFDMQDWYAKGGFNFAHRSLRMEGVGRPAQPASFLTELSSAPFSQLLVFDRKHFGFEREAFLRRWIDLPESLALAAVRDGELTGYGVIRACLNGYKIGPLFADDVETATALYDALADRAGGEAVFLDVPEINLAAMRLAEERGLKEVFGCARMYHGPKPALPWDSIFGVTTFELG